MSQHMLPLLVWTLWTTAATTCDEPQESGLPRCVHSTCIDPEWPYGPNRAILIMGDQLLAPSTYGGCSAVSSRLAELTSLHVETVASAAALLGSGGYAPQDTLGAADVRWLIINGGLNDIKAAHRQGQSLDLDTLLSPYAHGALPELVNKAIATGAQVVIVSYPIGSDVSHAERAQLDALMGLYDSFARSREGVYFVEMRDVTHEANASLFDAHTHAAPSWAGGLELANRIAAVVRQSLAASPPAHYTPESPPSICGLAELVQLELHACWGLDLQGELQPSETISAANLTVNSTVRTT